MTKPIAPGEILENFKEGYLSIAEAIALLEEVFTVPAATLPSREQVARTLALHLYNGASYDDCTEAEKDTFVNAADAVLALPRPDRGAR